MCVALLRSGGGHNKGPRGALWFGQNQDRTARDRLAPGRAAPPARPWQADSGEQMGRRAMVTGITVRPGPGRLEDLHSRRRPQDLRHPGPLNRGADRGVRGQHEHPAEGPAHVHASLAPRRGAVCLGPGTGTLDHVDHLALGEKGGRQAAGPLPQGPSARPLDLPKVAGAISFIDQCRGHDTPLRRSTSRPGFTCRKAVLVQH